MLETQFYLRLLFTALFGVVFIFAMLSLAKSNPISEFQKRYIGLKIVGTLLLIIGVFSAILSVYSICTMSFPLEMTEQPFSANMVVREVGAVLYWGYPTGAQQMAITMLVSFFASFAVGGYFFCFKKSHSNWWQKTLKTILIILTYTFYVSSTDWHYFDAPEFVATGSFAICIAIMFVISKVTNNVVASADVTSEQASKDISLSSVTETSDILKTDEPKSEKLYMSTDSSTIESKNKCYIAKMLKSTKLFIASKDISLPNNFSAIFKSKNFKTIGLIVGVVTSIFLGVLLFVSLKSYPDYITSYGDKFKHSFNVSNEKLSRQLISNAYSERFAGDFIIEDYDGYIVICDSTYFYNSLDIIEPMNSDIKVLSKPFKKPSSDVLQFVYATIVNFEDDYGSIAFYSKNSEETINDVLKEENIKASYYSIEDYKKRFEKWINYASEVYTDNTETTKEIARYYFANNNLNRAENTYKLAISHDRRNPELLGLLSFVQFKNNDMEEAEASARAAIKRDDTETTAATTLSMIYAYKSDWIQAAKWSKVAIDYGTDLAEAYYVYAAGLYNMGDKKAAKDYYNKAHNILPDNYYAEKYEEYGGCPVECLNLEHGFTDQKGDIVTEYGEKLLSSKSKYLSTRMEANALRTGRYTFDIKVFKNGILSTGDTRVSEGYSYDWTINIPETGKGKFSLGGWGSNTSGNWPAGSYRVEVWYKGEIVDESRFSIK